MDFFARQEHARAQTRQLILLFALAVIVVVVAVTSVLVLGFIVATGASSRQSSGSDLLRWVLAHPQLVGAAAVAVLWIILIGSTVRLMQLRDGGAVVARSMGADLVDAHTTDPLKKRLLNVVEEMAIASGVPVPAVYVMESENGINAFAAGNTVADSVITVTRGALDHLDRAELQGVVGHEFSHILNGDMKLNMQLLGLVAGLFAIAMVGRVLTRGSPRRGKGGVFAFVGIAMMMLGYVGLLLGRLIQAAIARQREFLADASSVQFTRDPHGLRDALVKIGATGPGSHLHSHETDEVAHMLFASGANDFFATHPPLVDRIRALDPSFQTEEFARVAAQLPPPPARAAVRSPEGGAALAAAPRRSSVDPSQVARNVARPRHLQVRHAERLRAALPAGLVADAADPSTARALLAALLWKPQGAEGPHPWGSLEAAFGADVAAAAADRRATLGALSATQRLPLLQELIPALGRLPASERQRLLEGTDRMVRADGTVTLSEYALARLARVHLGDQIAPPAGGARATLLQLEPELQTLCSVLACCGQADPARAQEAYEHGLMRALPGRRVPYRPIDDWVPVLDRALDRLDHLRPADKQRLVVALASIVAHDGTLDPAEAELLRAICGSLHCPLPPFVDEGPPV
jgi:Zn-dependent protease with chaperone function